METKLTFQNIFSNFLYRKKQLPIFHFKFFCLFKKQISNSPCVCHFRFLMYMLVWNLKFDV